MTDGAALPIYLSKNVDTLKKKGLIDNTITIGSAFGGEYECINIHTALITAKEVLNAAALTYVASMLVAMLNFLRFLIVMFANNRD